MTTMETLKNEDTSKLSRTEVRKQKLSEFLMAKGRFKLPNPKPYLKDSVALKKPTGATQSFQASCRGKENQTSSAASVRNNTMKKPLTEKTSTTSKTELRSSSKAPSATLQHTTLKSAASQTVQACRTLPKGTAIKGMSVKEQQTKPPIRTTVGTQKQVKTDPALKSEPGKSSCGIFRSVEHTAKQDSGRKQCVVKRESSVKVIPRLQVKCPTATEHLRNPSLNRNEAKTVTNTQTRLSQANHTKTVKNGVGQSLGSTHTGAIKGMKVSHLQTKNVRKVSETTLNKTKTAGSETASKKTLSGLNEPGNKRTLAVAQKPAAAAAKQRFPDVFKTGNAPKTSATASGNKNSLPQQQPNTVRPPLNPTLPVSVSQRAPHLSKGCTTAKKDVLPKTPKTAHNPGTQGVRTVPLDGKKKMTAAQEERMRKLQEWRESRGITYKRPPMPVKPVRRKTIAAVSQSYWATMEQEDQVHGFVCAVDQSLDDCIKLVAQGCDVDPVRQVLARLPMAQNFAKYWICQVKMMEKEGNLNVLPTFEEAVRVVREPVDELRSVVFEILKKKEAKGSCSDTIEEEKEAHGQEEGRSECDLHTPKPVRALIRGMKGDSSVIKYKITATPGGKMSQQREKSRQIDGHEIRFVTPVRRSVRIQKSAPRYPAALQDHDPCVTSYQDLLTGSGGEAERICATDSSSSPLYVYLENEALREQVQIELVYEEAEECLEK